MRRFQITLLALALSLTSNAQNFTPPAKGMAAIYFVRMESTLFSMADFYFYDTDKLIGYFHGAKYLRYECKPGEHMFWARAENRDFITANLMKDKVYLIEAVPIMGAMSDGVSLDFVDMNDKVIRERLTKILAKEPIVIAPEKLRKKAEDSKDALARGLEKYKEEKATGKKFVRIEKEMFVPIK